MNRYAILLLTSDKVLLQERMSMDREVIDVELMPQERRLLLKYGFPFDRIKRALESCTSKGIEIVPLDVFEFERLIGDLCISINEMRPSRVRNDLNELCDRLEFALRTGDGMLSEF
jgi:hypothetical protein